MADKPRIVGWVTDRAGCAHYRMKLPFAELAKQYDVQTVLWTPDQKTKMPKWADTDQEALVVAQRLGEWDYQLRVWQNLRARDRMLVYEIDDDFFSVPSSSPSGRVYNRPDVQKRVAECLRIASAVTVSTYDLRDALSKYNDNIHVLPNCIDESWFTDKLPDTTDYRYVIGWAGSNTHVEDFDEIVNPLRRYLRYQQNSIMLHTIGMSAYITKEFNDMSNVRIDNWFKDPVEYHRTVDFDIALLPLKASMFNRSKSDVKFLEMAAKGICCVAANVGPYAKTIVHGETGFLYNHSHELPGILRELTNDNELRLRVGKNAQAYARTRTIAANIDMWMDTYHAVGLKQATRV